MNTHDTPRSTGLFKRLPQTQACAGDEAEAVHAQSGQAAQDNAVYTVRMFKRLAGWGCLLQHQHRALEWLEDGSHSAPEAVCRRVHHTMRLKIPCAPVATSCRVRARAAGARYLCVGHERLHSEMRLPGSEQPAETVQLARGHPVWDECCFAWRSGALQSKVRKSDGRGNDAVHKCWYCLLQKQEDGAVSEL